MKVNKHQPDGHWQDVALIQFAHFSELFAKHFSWFSGEDLLIAVTGKERVLEKMVRLIFILHFIS